MYDSRQKLNQHRIGCGCSVSDIAKVVDYILGCDLPEFLDGWLLIAIAVDNAFDVPTRSTDVPYNAGALSCALGTVDMILDSPDHEYPDLYHMEPCDMCGRPQCKAPECDTARAAYAAHCEEEEDDCDPGCELPCCSDNPNDEDDGIGHARLTQQEAYDHDNPPMQDDPMENER